MAEYAQSFFITTLIVTLFYALNLTMTVSPNQKNQTTAIASSFWPICTYKPLILDELRMKIIFYNGQ